MRNPYAYDYCGCGRAKVKQAAKCRSCFTGTSANTGSLADRLWGRVQVGDPDVCWLWTGAVAKNGYGQYSRRYAHRLIYEAARGPIPTGLFVCHSCDTPLCVNPRHLWLGTNGDNMRDALLKGRTARGERNPQARLTPSAVQAIRQAISDGATHQGVADLFGVSRRTVGHIVSGDTWAWLANEAPVQLALGVV